jgi:23S rRNA (pseudouridine1915-N3)-methyltransferase
MRPSEAGAHPILYPITMLKVTLIQLGKTHFKFVDTGFDEFASRLKHYCKFESLLIELPSRLKSNQIEQIKKNEADLLLAKIKPNDYIILLDENGKTFGSVAFAKHLEKLSIQHSQICFVIGGAYGFSQDVYNRANAKISLSEMTFSHQLIRLIFAEQLYRAFTIIKNEPYHHE